VEENNYKLSDRLYVVQEEDGLHIEVDDIYYTLEEFQSLNEGKISNGYEDSLLSKTEIEEIIEILKLYPVAG